MASDYSGFDFTQASTSKVHPVQESVLAPGTITAEAKAGPLGLVILEVDFPETRTSDPMTRQSAEALLESLQAVLS